MSPAASALIHGPQDAPKTVAYTPRTRASVASAASMRHMAARGRPLSAPAGAKTEQWREAGRLRWPDAPREAGKTLEGAVPFHRYDPPCLQPCWKGELWTRSLRTPGGMSLHDARYGGTAHVGVKELHEEWRQCNSARQYRPLGPSVEPYGGATVSGSASLPRKHNFVHWVEKPVATGRYALDHFDGSRYKWDRRDVYPRFTAKPTTAAPDRDEAEVLAARSSGRAGHMSARH